MLIRVYTIKGERYIALEGAIYRLSELIDEDNAPTTPNPHPPKRKPQAPPAAKKKKQADTPTAQSRSSVDEATIKQIKEMYADGKSMKEIKDTTGVSYPTIYKYTSLERKQRKHDEDERFDDDLEPEEPEDDGMDDEDNF
jgi:hypothetical protein